MSDKRKLSVEPFDSCGDYGRTSRASLVRLKGKWLQRAGFMPGDKLELTIVSPGVIELRLLRTPAASREYLEACRRLDASMKTVVDSEGDERSAVKPANNEPTRQR